MNNKRFCCFFIGIIIFLTSSFFTGFAEETTDSRKTGNQGMPFTVAWVSDTQTIIKNGLPYFAEMTRYIEEQHTAKNILCMLHSGDFADALFRDDQRNLVLDALSELKSVPAFAVAGNHDFGKKNPTIRRFYLFPLSTRFLPSINIKRAVGFIRFWKAAEKN